MSDTPEQPDLTPSFRIPLPTGEAWATIPRATLRFIDEGEAPLAFIPISPQGMRLVQAITALKAQLYAETQRPVSDFQALEYLQNACDREEDEDGPWCIQEGTDWCREYCPFNDLPPHPDGPLAWG